MKRVYVKPVVVVREFVPQLLAGSEPEKAAIRFDTTIEDGDEFEGQKDFEL